jgi:cysteine synthase
MTREQAISYVAFVVDDAGAGRELGADPHAIVRQEGPEFKYSSKLVGWQCGFEPLFVAVHSYLDVGIDDQEAEDMAREYLEERGWFAGESKDADYIIT